MSRRTPGTLILFWGLLAVAPTFATEPEFQALMSLQGEWQGHWQGMNLDSGEITETPVQLTISATEQPQWLEEQVTTPQSRFAQYVEVQPPYRVIQQFQHAEYEQERELTSFHYVSDEVWTLRFEFSAIRQQRPVRVRQTWQRLPQQLSREEEVDYQDDKGTHWIRRQTLQLNRLSAPDS